MREVAGPLVGRGHIGDLRDAFGHARALVVGEEEQAIAADGPADRAAELAPAVVRRRFIARREEVPRIHRAVAEEPVAGAVEVVRARLQHDVYLPGAIPADLRLVAARHDLELANRVDRRPYRRGVQLRVHVVHAVEQEAVGVLAPAGGREREVASHRAGRSLGGRRRARGQQRQLQEVAAVKRQVHDLRVLHDGAYSRRVALERNRRRHDQHLLRRRADLQRDVHPKVLTDEQLELLDVCLEPVAAHLEPIRTRRQRADDVLAVVGRLDGTDEVGVAMRHSGLRPAGQRPGGVADDAADGGAGGLRPEGGGTQDQ